MASMHLTRRTLDKISYNDSLTMDLEPSAVMDAVTARLDTFRTLGQSSDDVTLLHEPSPHSNRRRDILSSNMRNRKPFEDNDSILRRSYASKIAAGQLMEEVRNTPLMNDTARTMQSNFSYLPKRNDTKRLPAVFRSVDFGNTMWRRKMNQSQLPSTVGTATRDSIAQRGIFSGSGKTRNETMRMDRTTHSSAFQPNMQNQTMGASGFGAFRGK